MRMILKKMFLLGRSLEKQVRREEKLFQATLEKWASYCSTILDMGLNVLLSGSDNTFI